MGLLNQVFGRLTVVEETKITRSKTRSGSIQVYQTRAWVCLCECGKTTVALKAELTSGLRKSCGCLNRETKSFVDISGLVFGNFTVLSRTDSDRHGLARWRCACVCGGETVFSSVSIRKSKSHYCSHCDTWSTLDPNPQRRRHGLRCKREYDVWTAIKQRCNNPNCNAYENYGGRGITICDAWNEDFLAFFNDMGKRPSPKHTIERIDNSKGYEPSNCKWATRSEQAANRRNNRLLTHLGKTLTVKEWSEETGINYRTIMTRLSKGWPAEKTLTAPVKNCGRKSQA